MPNMHEHENLSYPALIRELQILVREERTGALFVLSESSHVARIGLVKGRVVSCVYGNHKGQDAVALISRIQACKYSFTQGDPSVISTSSQNDNVDLFWDIAAAALGKDSVSPPSASPKGNLADGKSSGATFAPLAIPTGSMNLRVSNGELFELVVREFAMYLGPVARMVAGEFEQQLRTANSVGQVMAILAQLAQKIGNPKQAREFETRMLKLVAK